MRLKEKFSDTSPEFAGRGLQKGVGSNFNTPFSWGRASKILEAEGWNYLSNGAFSYVFERESDPHRVLKLTSQNGDQAYMRFWSIAKRTENPHFPEVSRLGRLRVGKWNLFAVLVERLKPMPPDGNQDMVSRLRGESTAYLRGDTIPRWISVMYPEWIAALDMIKPALDVKKTVRYRGRHAFDFKPYRLDLNSGNLMWRGNTPVITDPLAS